MKIISFTFLYFVCAMLANAQLVTNTKKQELDKYIDYLEENNQIIGRVSITENGKTVYARNMGQADLPAGTKIVKNQKYQIGSITKMFTAVMLAKLQEQGKLSFNDKLASYFPEMPQAAEITISQMLNHTSGMQDYLTKNDTISNWLYHSQTQKDILAEIQRQGLLFEPGTETNYSNSAYYLLARIVEIKTEKNYATALKNLITKPLKLKHTLAYKENSVFKKTALPYLFMGTKWEQVDDLYFYNTSGVGDMLSTTDDLNLFMNALFSGKILNKKTLNSMLPADGKDFGLGIMRIPFYQHISFGHGGNTETHSLVGFNPKSNISISYTVNGQRYLMNEVYAVMVSTLYDIDFDYPIFTNFVTTPEDYPDFTGIYSCLTFPEDVTIINKGTYLQIQTPNERPLTLSQIGTKNFILQNADLTLAFSDSGDSLMLIYNGESHTMSKK